MLSILKDSTEKIITFKKIWSKDRYLPNKVVDREQIRDAAGIQKIVTSSSLGFLVTLLIPKSIRTI